MLKFKPFNSIRYSESTASFGEVLAPPYDVISSIEQDALYDRHPHNVVRLDLGKQFATDTELDNRYTRAKQQLSEWMANGILVQDSEPAYYFYAHTYTADGVTKDLRGVFAAAQLHPFEDRIILPHENTMPGPIEDRLRLTQACEANLSPVYTLFDDPNGTFFEMTSPIWNQHPLVDTTTQEGDRYRLWKVVDTQFIQRMYNFFYDKNLLIADGHHRYTTALHYQQSTRPSAIVSDPTSDYTLLFATPLQNPGLTIYPTHRAIFGHDGFSPDQFLDAISDYFSQSHCPDIDSFKKLAAADCKKSIGVMFPGSETVIRLTLLDDEKWKLLCPADASNVLKGLDVSILQYVILQHVLGYTLETIRRQEGIRYLKSDSAILDALKDGQTQAVFVLQATQLDEMRDVCMNGEKMPQKSTYFYPKLITGLVMNPVKSSESSVPLTYTINPETRS